jgi:hypothetical protein
VLCLTQYSCSVYAKHSAGSKIILDAPEVTRLKWKLISVHLEIVLILMQDSCSVCAERTIGSKIVLTHPMVLLGDVGHMEYCFGPFGDSVSVAARQVHGLCQMYNRLTNHFGHTRWYS